MLIFCCYFRLTLNMLYWRDMKNMSREIPFKLIVSFIANHEYRCHEEFNSLIRLNYVLMLILVNVKMLSTLTHEHNGRRRLTHLFSFFFFFCTSAHHISDWETRSWYIPQSFRPQFNRCSQYINQFTPKSTFTKCFFFSLTNWLLLLMLSTDTSKG